MSCRVSWSFGCLVYEHAYTSISYQQPESQPVSLIYSPTNWPICPIVTFSGTARVDAPVLRRLPVNQLRRGGILANENVTATQSMPYRALKESGGSAPTNTIKNVNDVDVLWISNLKYLGRGSRDQR